MKKLERRKNGEYQNSKQIERANFAILVLSFLRASSYGHSSLADVEKV